MLKRPSPVSSSTSSICEDAREFPLEIAEALNKRHVLVLPWLVRGIQSKRMMYVIATATLIVIASLSVANGGALPEPECSSRAFLDWRMTSASTERRSPLRFRSARRRGDRSFPAGRVKHQTPTRSQ